MTSEIRVPGDVSPLERLLEIKNQQIQDILEYNDKKKSPYRKWIQMNNDEKARDADDWLVAKSSSAYRIFKFLVSNMDRFNAVICSYKVLQEKLGYSKPTVERAIRLLKEHKYIETVRTGGANVYMINKYLYWNSWGINYAFAEFDAKVIISSSEQDAIIQKQIALQIKKRQEVLIRDPHEENQNFNPQLSKR